MSMDEIAKTAPKSENDYVIEMLNITKRFPGIIANDNITLQLRRGEISDADDAAHTSSSGAMCALSHACSSARPSSDIGNVRSSSISLFS